MALCGPKLSLCGVILSAWGIVQLALMGIFFYTNSVALVEDLPLEEEYPNSEELLSAMETGYTQNAYNCWIAALLYLVTLCVSVQQFWMNNRSTYSVWAKSRAKENEEEEEDPVFNNNNYDAKDLEEVPLLS